MGLALNIQMNFGINKMSILETFHFFTDSVILVAAVFMLFGAVGETIALRKDMSRLEDQVEYRVKRLKDDIKGVKDDIKGLKGEGYDTVY